VVAESYDAVWNNCLVGLFHGCSASTASACRLVISSKVIVQMVCLSSLNFVLRQVRPLPKCKYISELAKLVHIDLELVQRYIA
jgi:hypothetical protein